MSNNNRMLGVIMALLFVLFVAVCMSLFLQVFAGHCSAHNTVLTCNSPYFISGGGLFVLFALLFLARTSLLDLFSPGLLFMIPVHSEQTSSRVEPLYLTNQVFIL